MSPRLILGYLHHAQAVTAIERLEAIHNISLPYSSKAYQRRELDRLRRLADGEASLTPAEEAAQNRAVWDADWKRLRSRLGARAPERGRLRPGDRVVIPAG